MSSPERKIAQKESRKPTSFIYYGSLLTNYRLFSHDQEYRRVWCPSYVLVTDHLLSESGVQKFKGAMTLAAIKYYQAVGVPSHHAPYEVRWWVYGPGYRRTQLSTQQYPLVPSTLPYVKPLEYEIQIGFGWNGNYRTWARMTLPGVYFEGGGGTPIRVPQWPSISEWIAEQLDVTIPGVGISVIVGAPNWQGKGIPPVFEFGYEFSLLDALSFGTKRAIPFL